MIGCKWEACNFSSGATQPRRPLIELTDPRHEPSPWLPEINLTSTFWSPTSATLLAREPFHQERDFRAFDAREALGSKFEKLVYFSGSIFWRACLNGWRFAKRPTMPLQVGPYEEELRRFLLGDSAFPANILLIVSASLNPNNATAVAASTHSGDTQLRIDSCAR